MSSGLRALPADMRADEAPWPVSAVLRGNAAGLKNEGPSYLLPRAYTEINVHATPETASLCVP